MLHFGCKTNEKNQKKKINFMNIEGVKTFLGLIWPYLEVPWSSLFSWLLGSNVFWLMLRGTNSGASIHERLTSMVSVWLLLLVSSSYVPATVVAMVTVVGSSCWILCELRQNSPNRQFPFKKYRHTFGTWVQFSTTNNNNEKRKNNQSNLKCICQHLVFVLHLTTYVLLLFQWNLFPNGCEYNEHCWFVCHRHMEILLGCSWFLTRWAK